MKKTSVIALLISSALPVAAAITYVDATVSNTTLADGSAYTPTASTINNDNEWSLRTFGNPENDRTVYTTNDSNANPGEDGPMLRSTIGGLAIGSVYDIYVYFWGAGNDAPIGNQRWDIQAGLTPTALSFYDTQNATNLGHATTGVDPATYFTNNSPNVIVADADRRLYQAHLGTATADDSGNIHVFIDDAPGNANRTWYDGVGYEVIPEPGAALLGALGLLGLLRRRRN
jgi:hypothetical protein